MLVLREHKYDLLSAVPCAMGVAKMGINIPRGPDASVLGSSLDILESIFLICSNCVMAPLQTSEAINKNLKIIHPIKLMSFLETLRLL